MDLGPSQWGIYLVVAIIFSFATAEIADRKGYDKVMGFFVGFLFGCLGLFIVAVLPKKPLVTAGGFAKFVSRSTLANGTVVAKGYATKVHDVEVRDGKISACIDTPNGERIWVQSSALRPA